MTAPPARIAGTSCCNPWPAHVRSVQPGGGPISALASAWARTRRGFLRRFRPAYVARCHQGRVADCPGCTHEVIDARDLLRVRNVCGVRFDPAHDLSPWHDGLGLVRVARPEIVATTLLASSLGCALALLHPVAAAPCLLLPAFAAWFFRDPERTPPAGDGLVVAPADGVLDDIRFEPECPFFAGPAVRLGIFLSLLDVHVNRAPVAGVAVRFDYRPGDRRATYRVGHTDGNEQLVTWFAAAAPRPLPIVVRQIAGPAARRVCNVLQPGQRVTLGERFGLIKFGSRTELWLPHGCAQIVARAGDRVRGGVTVMARLGLHAACSR